MHIQALIPKLSVETFTIAVFPRAARGNKNGIDIILPEPFLQVLFNIPESSNIVGYGYDAASQILMIEFNNGGKYNYFDVPEIVYEGMVGASSKGQYLAQQIKGIYRYARV